MQFNEPIAIVGISCRLPQCNDLDQFWSLLIEGKDGTSPPPSHRWLQSDYPNPIPENCRNMNAGFLTQKVDEFDSGFFGISPKEAIFMDPQQRLLHELVWEGLEDAGIDPHSLNGTNGGVFVGSWTNDYKDILLQSGYDEFYRRYMGNSIGAAAAKISFLLGLTGPSISTESGCSSSMVAVHLACRSLILGETDIALTCGVNLLLKPFDKDELPVMLSPEGKCKPFDAKADGFARAEGGGVLVLKRLHHAIEANDRIWAVIRGTAISQEGLSKSMGTPTVHSEAMSMELALKNAHVDPSDVSYIEAHGTGTVVGDPMEILAITKAYSSHSRPRPLMIGSVKGNVGHTESTSGITGIIKVVLAMHHETIPRQINFRELNPAINLDCIPAEIPTSNTKWNTMNGKARLAGVSSFGITGTDAHVILEEAPITETTSAGEMERPYHLVKVSAKSEEALNILLAQYNDKFAGSLDNLEDIAYTSNVGRADFKYRAAIVTKSNTDAISSIERGEILRGEEISSNDLGKICFLFTGQGSQYPGMGKQLYECSPLFKFHFDKCADFLMKLHNINIKQVLWGELPQEISRTIYSQTGIFCVEYSLLKLWESWGVSPDYVIGHSLGEFAAAVCAGILSFKDALKMVAERSRLINELPTGKMLVIRADKENLINILKEFSTNNGVDDEIDIAAVNSNEQTVVAGDEAAITEFSRYCSVKGLKSTILEATHAFHSSHMDPILEEYGQITGAIKHLGLNKSKYISGMLGKVIEENELNSKYWIQHTRKPVLFLDASQEAVKLGCKVFIEIGPQPVLSALTKVNNPVDVITLPSIKRNGNDWQTMLTSLGQLYVRGHSINWRGLDNDYSRKKVGLPHYPFMGKRYWPDVISIKGNAVHPLLGSPIPNASSTKLFQSAVNLKSLEYMKDHIIGQDVIFPGAGYLDMCLAAGWASFESTPDFNSGPSRPMAVNDLVIDAPLLLYDSSTCQMQSLVELVDKQNSWSSLTVKIFHRHETGPVMKWVKHVEASFTPMLSAEDQKFHVEMEMHFGVKDDEDSIKEVYRKLAKGGLNFGPNFQSLEKFWELNGRSVFKIKTPPQMEKGNARKSYIVHPIILDSMLQAIMFVPLINKQSLWRKKLDKKRIFVPVRIGKFIWFSQVDLTTEYFVHVFPSMQGTDQITEKTAVLTDHHGNVKCMMTSVELVDTTARAVESILKQQTSQIPDLWEETWKQEDGYQMHRFDLHSTIDSKFYSDELLQDIARKSNTPPKSTAELYHLLNRRSYLYIVQALIKCGSGWNPEVEDTFTTDELMQQLLIKQEHGHYLNFVLKVLEAEGHLNNVGGSEWRVKSKFPKAVETKRLLAMEKGNQSTTCKTIALQDEIGKNLADILQGNISALSILFPGTGFQRNDDTASVHHFYGEYIKLSGIQDLAEKVLKERIRHLLATGSQSKRDVFRILEVGAGTGGFTRIMLEILSSEGIEFEYTFSDISPSFFFAAQEEFDNYSKHMKFKKLDVEKDPLEQGFVPEYFDYVCGYEIIHATRDIAETLQNLRLLLREHGKLDIIDTTKVNRYITYCFGLLSGYWNFQDHDLRRNHCTIDRLSWEKVLTENGFKVEQFFPVLMENHSLICSYRNNQPVPILNRNPDHTRKTWLVFHERSSPVSEYLVQKLRSSNRNVVLILARPDKQTENREMMEDIQVVPVDPSNEEEFMLKLSSIRTEINLEGVLYCWALENKKSQENFLRPFFYLVKFVSAFSAEDKKRLKIVVLTKGNLAVGDDYEMSTVQTSTLWGFCKTIRNEMIDLPCRCVDMDPTGNEGQNLEIFQELFYDGKESEVALRNSMKFYSKLSPWKPPPPNKENLVLPAGTNRFQLIHPDTKSIADLRFGALGETVPAPNEIEVKVEAMALNFKDILAVLKPTEFFRSTNIIGQDFVGEVQNVGNAVTKWKVGDKVFGLNGNDQALPSHVKVNEGFVIPLPDDVPCAEAVTLPAVFSTAYHCLIEVAKLTSEDTVLIHTASGGVGLVAIDICKHIGAKIIATAGTKMKRRFLKGIGIDHVYNSRNTGYSDEILKVTKGQGVNVVLNSLTSDGFKEATLRSCAKGARFIEMSKLNIWQPGEVIELRPDISYTIVDLSSFDGDSTQRLLLKLQEYLQRKIVKPLPYRRFDAVNIRQALQFLQRAKLNIGKVVCMMPEFRQVNGEIKYEFPLFNSRSTYLITGGLGGIGMLTCKWMLEKGAKHIILASRSLPNPEMLKKILEINLNMNGNVVSVPLDVSDYEDCKYLLESKINEMGFPPLRGIMHAAGVLSDGLIANQTWDQLSKPFKSKVAGTMNLHELTKNMNLEFFVLFSSIVANFGNSGQSNHAAANYFEDTFAKYRRSLGLPASTINWGPWCEVGVAMDVDFPGIRPISNLEGLSALELVLRLHRTQTTVVNVEALPLFSRFVPEASKVIDETYWKKIPTIGTTGSSGLFVKPEEFWSNYESKETQEEKLCYLKLHIKNTLKFVLKLGECEEQHDDMDFQDLGVDSLMFVEIRNNLQAMLGERVTVNVNLLRDYSTVRSLTTALHKTIEMSTSSAIN